MAQDYIIFDSRKMAAFQLITDLCREYAFEDTFAQELWSGLLENPLLYDEFVYYMQTKELTGAYTCQGYSMFDLYFYQLRHYNFRHDIGKNRPDCDKGRLILEAFHTMICLTNDPDSYVAKLRAEQGMDF